MRRRRRGWAWRIWWRPTTCSGPIRRRIIGAAGVGTTQNAYHDPFVLFGFLSGCTRQIGFAVGVLILAQRQAVLVAKQAASLDVLCGGRFRLGIGVGWNEVEFTGLNENFHNRGRRSAEQVRVMQALWAEPHVNFAGEVSQDRRRRDQSAPGLGPRADLVWRARRGNLPPLRPIRRWLYAARLSAER